MHTENEYHRGEIFFINEGESSGSEQGGARPGIIVSNDVGNKHAPIVEVVYLTSREKKLMPTHVRIKSSPIPSIALCEQIETVYKKRIGKYLAKATMDEMKQIDKALAVSIGLGGNMKMSDYVREWAEAFKERLISPSTRICIPTMNQGMQLKCLKIIRLILLMSSTSHLADC